MRLLGTAFAVRVWGFAQDEVQDYVQVQDQVQVQSRSKTKSKSSTGLMRLLATAVLAVLALLATPAAAHDREPQAPQVRVWLQGGAVDDWRGGSGAFGGGLSAGYRERWIVAAVGASGTLAGTYQDVAALGLLGPTVVVGARERLSVLAAGGWRRTRVTNDPYAEMTTTLPFAGVRVAFDQLEAGGAGFGVFVQATRDLRSKPSIPGQRWRASALLVGLSFAIGD